MSNDNLTSSPRGDGNRPTPEEISARLEALLKRTHSLRQSKSADGASRREPDATWPPSDGDLAEFEVFDVPAGSGSVVVDQAPRRLEPAGRTGDAAPPRPSEEVPPGPDHAAAGPSEKSEDFGRPDWSTLRMREAVVTDTVIPAWVWLVIGALVVALGIETAYLLRTAPWARQTPSAVQGAVLQIDGGPGMRVRVNDAAARTVPFEAQLSGNDPIRLAIDTEESAVAAPDRTAATPSAAAGPQAAAPSPTATTGSVTITSTPAGAMVTMEGRERGVTPLTIDRLKPGRHDVLIVGTGVSQALKVDVVAGQTSRLDVGGAGAR